MLGKMMIQALVAAAAVGALAAAYAQAAEPGPAVNDPVRPAAASAVPSSTTATPETDTGYLQPGVRPGADGGWWRGDDDSRGGDHRRDGRRPSGRDHDDRDRHDDNDDD